jgi:hypothetical protein
MKINATATRAGMIICKCVYFSGTTTASSNEMSFYVVGAVVAVSNYCVCLGMALPLPISTRPSFSFSKSNIAI